MTTAIKDQIHWRSRSRIELARISFWILVMLLLLLPVERVAWPMGAVPADVALAAIIALFWPVAWARHRRVAFPLLLPMWLIFVASSLATLFSPVPTTGMQTMIQEAYIYLGFVSAANLLAWLDEENMHRLNKIWIIIACIEGVLTVMGALKIGPSFLYQSPIPGKRHYEFEGIQRAFATFANPNAAGGYLMTAFFVFMATPWPCHPLLRLAVGGWLFLGIYATGSNGALGGTLVGLAFYFLHWVLTQEDRQAVRLWIALGTLMAAVVIAPLLVGFSYSSLLSPSVAKSDLLATTVARVGSGVERRTGLLGIGWEFFSHNPLGVGPAGVPAIFGVGLHNDYMAFLAERGVLGLIGLLLLITLTMACVLASARLADGDRARQLQAIALGGGFVAYYADAMAHEVFHTRSLWFLMAMIFAHYYVLRQRVGQVAGMKSNMSIASLGKNL
jgi:O-antigen ligase